MVWCHHCHEEIVEYVALDVEDWHCLRVCEACVVKYVSKFLQPYSGEVTFTLTERDGTLLTEERYTTFKRKTKFMAGTFGMQRMGLEKETFASWPDLKRRLYSQDYIRNYVRTWAGKKRFVAYVEAKLTRKRKQVEELEEALRFVRRHISDEE